MAGTPCARFFIRCLLWLVCYDMNGNKEALPGGTLLYTGAGLPITTDALLLAEFCPVKPRWSLCDLGSGTGILLFSLVDKGLLGRAVGVDIDPAAVALLTRAAAENGLDERVTGICADLAAYHSPQPFDLVVANPPYFATGRLAKAPQRAAARHQLQCTLPDVCAAARRLLKDGGRFCLCWPAGDMAALFGALSQHSLAPKRLQWVRRTAQDNARLALLETVKAGGPGLTVLPDRLLPPGSVMQY